MVSFRGITALLRGLKLRRWIAASDKRLPRALRKQIEAVVSETEPRIRWVRGYEKRLAPAVEAALGHCRELVSGIPGPFDLRAQRWGQDPMVTALFATVEEAKDTLGSCPALRRHFTESREPNAYALLTMSPEEKPVYGTAISGEILRRDVQRRTLNFSRHRFISPSAELDRVRETLRERAFHFLLTCALEQIAALKEQEERLDRQQEILEVQWRLQQSRERGLDPPSDRQGRRILSEVREELDDVRSRIDEPSDYLELVAGVLRNPERLLRMEAASPRVSQMGVKLKPSDPEPGHPVAFARIFLGPKGRTMAAVLARVHRAEIMGRSGEESTQ